MIISSKPLVNAIHVICSLLSTIFYNNAGNSTNCHLFSTVTAEQLPMKLRGLGRSLLLQHAEREAPLVNSTTTPHQQQHQKQHQKQHQQQHNNNTTNNTPLRRTYHWYISTCTSSSTTTPQPMVTRRHHNQRWSTLFVRSFARSLWVGWLGELRSFAVT